MSSTRAPSQVPTTPFPAILLRSGVLFPHTSLTVRVVRAPSVRLFERLEVGDVIGAIYLRDPDIDDPVDVDLHTVGTLTRITGIKRSSERGFMVTLQGLERFRFEGLAQRDPFHLVRASPHPDVDSDVEDAALLAGALRKQLSSMLGREGGALAEVLKQSSDPSVLGDRIAPGLGLSVEDGISLLEIASVPTRLRKLTDLCGRAAVQSQLRSKIEGEVREKFGKHQRKAILREQLAAIQRELGEDEDDDEVTKLSKALDAAKLPESARKVADRELERLRRSEGHGAESNVIRNYLELLASLPWSERSETADDIAAIADKLDEDHTGLEEAKKRVLEYMAVTALSKRPQATILCLSGPPGVGKTSLARSIADATGRSFVRVALGGVRDESELRGHRRTYVGALPGRIINGLRSAGAKNPVVLLDEIDKLGSAWGRSSESAMLEILDPEQNAHFVDHYLETEFDLSEVLFICTANDLAAISAPLRDRMEIVELGGYTREEKLDIARKHLIPRTLEHAGLTTERVRIADDVLRSIIDDYTREAGVRQLDRNLGRVVRAVALDVARSESGTDETVDVDIERVRGQLGRPKFRDQLAEHTNPPGVATGLAWTPFGGDILFVESSRMPGNGRLTITGKLGDVMKESAQAAATYVRSHAEEFGLQDLDMDRHDLHIHVPAGAVPKDGPSAGVTIFSALTSLLTQRPLRSDTAMTGECSLRGRVLPVGGIKAKLLAAHRAGLRRVLIPKANVDDLEDVPDSVLEDLEVIPVENMDEVLDAAFDEAASTAELLVDPTQVPSAPQGSPPQKL